MKNVKFPEQMSEELAELTGIHFGDGSLYLDNKYNYNLTYSCNLAEDAEFIEYVNYLFNKLFDIRLHILIQKRRNCIALRIRSKNLFFFFNQVLKIPIGRKTNLSIPYWIKSDKIFLAAFLRGLFDTDGCITIQKFSKYQYILVKISTKHHDFAKQVKDSLAILDIPSFVTKKDTSVNNKIFVGYDVVVRNKNIAKFFEVVGSKNPRNLRKYKDMGT